MDGDSGVWLSAVAFVDVELPEFIAGVSGARRNGHWLFNSTTQQNFPVARLTGRRVKP